METKSLSGDFLELEIVKATLIVVVERYPAAMRGIFFAKPSGRARRR